jgi:hypothetical protein
LSRSAITRRARAAAAIALGLLFGLATWASLARPGWHADYETLDNAARMLAAGRLPYGFKSDAFGGAPVLHPPPMLWLLGLATWLPPAAAGGVVFGLGTALLAYLLTARAWWPLYAIASGPYFYAAGIGQLAPWAALPVVAPASLGVLAALKPSTGLAALAASPSWRVALRTAALLAAVVALTFIVHPGWLVPYLRGLGMTFQHGSPALERPGAALAVLALFRWRDSGARLLVALVLVPHALYWYDEVLLLAALPRSKAEALALSAFATAGWVAWQATSFATGEPFLLLAPDFVAASCYVPALFVVLRHPLAPDGSPWWLARLRAPRRA